jgi:hypothetical protein
MDQIVAQYLTEDQDLGFLLDISYGNFLRPLLESIQKPARNLRNKIFAVVNLKSDRI